MLFSFTSDIPIVKSQAWADDDNDNFFDPEPSDSEDSSNKKRSPRRENAFDLLPGLRDVPVGRAQRSFLRAGLHQSVGVGRTEDDSVDDEEEVEVERTTKSEVIDLEVESGNPVIDGRALKVSLSKKDVQVFGAARLWDKTQRSTLCLALRISSFCGGTRCKMSQ